MPTQFVLFAAGLTESPAGRGTVAEFAVDQVRSIVGPEVPIAPGARIVRVESASPVELPGVPESLQFRGTAQHLNYTAAPQRADLESRSRTAFPATEPVHCVLIPLRKTAVWWQLPPEARAAHFQQAQAHHQHVAIGAPFVERIYRRLLHSRYCGGAEAPVPYDFVTYFEFLDRDRAAFEDLLAGLRDTVRNPEWAYVDFEFEVWMHRLS
jgi:hypothetical protein